MAGFDKFCEFSGAHPGWAMHHFKHNHIQILPEFRKNFRQAKARLVILKVKAYWESKGLLTPLYPYVLNGWIPGKTDPVTPHEWLAYQKRKGGRLILQYNYVLEVEDEALFGNVKGKYRNFAYDISSVRRRLSRMLGYKVPVEWACERQSFRQRKTSWNKPVNLSRLGYTDEQLGTIANHANKSLDPS
jgi:hypothetical protein